VRDGSGNIRSGSASRFASRRSPVVFSIPASLGFAPCELCWWQRIFLYPQTILLAIAYFTDDEHIHKYSIALSSLASFFAAYNLYLQFGNLAPASATQPVSPANSVFPRTVHHFADHVAYRIRALARRHAIQKKAQEADSG